MSLQKLAAIAAVIVLLTWSSIFAQDPAADLYRAGEFREALKIMLQRLEDHPTNVDNRYMVAQTLFLLGENDKALEHWLECEKTLEDSDLILKEKLIQTCERLNKLEEVSSRIEALVSLRKLTKEKEYAKKKFFCRDQFEVAGKKYMSFHYFDFPAESDTCYTIVRVEPDGKIQSKFKFWCMDVTNKHAKLSGTLKEGERLHHIDEYENGGQRNHLHTKKHLAYREFKKLVVRVLNERAEKAKAEANAN